MKTYLATAAFMLAGLMTGTPMAFAQLERMGPISNVNGYPQWFQDKTGLAFEFCSPLTQQELVEGWCLILPGAPGTAPQFPEVFPDPASFSDEHFYWSASAAATTGSLRARLDLALEGAFANGP